MNLPRPLPGLVATLSLGFIATQAQAQNYRPDAEGYPCSMRVRLAVVQDDQGYSIRPVQAENDEPAVAAPIAIGTALKVDAKIFARSLLAAQEVSHAPRR